MMIVPEEYVTAYETAVDGGESKDIVTFLLETKAKEGNEEMPLAIATNLKVDAEGYITGGLVNIKYENLNRNFYGFGYYELNDEIVSATPATVDNEETYSRRSIAEVASNAILSGDYDNAEGDTLEELNDIKSIFLQSVNQSNGVTESESETATPELKLNYETATTHIRGAVDLNSTNGVDDGLIAYTSNATSVATVDETGNIVGVGAGSATITATLFDTITATCEVTVDPVEVYNAENVTVTAESATKGSVTFTSHEDAYLTHLSGGAGTTIAIRGDYDDEFIKVGFTTPSDLSNPGTGDWSTFMADTLGVGARFNANMELNPILYRYNVLPTIYGGGMKVNANGQNFYISWYANKLKSGTFSLSANTKYYYVYGITDNVNKTSVKSDKDYNVYFAILDANENLICSYHVSKSGNLDSNVYYQDAPQDEGSLIVTSCLPSTERTVTYEVLSKDTALELIASDLSAPTLSCSGGSVSWDAVKWADAYNYKIDDADWSETTDTSIELGVDAHTVQVKAFNSDLESAIATIDYLYLGEDVELKNATNVSIDKLSLESGRISFTNTKSSTASARTASTALLLKKQYSDELLRVKFVAKGTSWYTQTMSFGLRQTVSPSNNDWLNEWAVNPESSNGVWASNYTNNQHQVYPFSSGYGGGNIYGDSLSWTSMFTADTTYYAITGVIGTGDTATLYFGIQDANQQWLKLVGLPWGAIQARHNSAYSTYGLPELPDTGWFAIYDASNLGGDGAIEYDFITLSATVKNASTSSVSYNQETGVTSVTLTPITESTNTSNSGTIIVEGSYRNEFIKVGFTGVAGNLRSQNLAIGARRTAIATAANAGSGLQFFPHATSSLSGVVLWSNGANAYAGTHGEILDKTVDLTSSTAIEDGRQYYIYCGVIGSYTAATDTTEAVDTIQYYCAVYYVDDNGEEVLMSAFRWDSVKIAGIVSYWGGRTNYGFFEIFYFGADVEKTLTYEIVDSAPIIEAIDPAE